MPTTPSSQPLTRAQLLASLDVLAAHTQHELDAAEQLALEVAALADQAAARLHELAGLRSKVIAACAIADNARPTPLRRHRRSLYVRQIA